MKQVRLGDCLQKVSTWNPLRSTESSSFVYVDIGSVDQHKKEIINPQTIKCADAPSRARQLIKFEDVLVSTVRPNLNAVALVGAGLAEATASTGFCVLRSNKKLIDPAYLFNWVKSQNFISDMTRKATGASYPAVSDRIIFDSLITLPPLLDQKRIAAILNKADDIRSKRELAIAKLDALAISKFDEMFGNDGICSTTSSKITLGECLRLINGRAYLQHELLDEGTPIIRIQNLNGGDKWYYSGIELPEEKYCDNGDLLFAWSATFGPYIWHGAKSIYHYHIWKIEPSARINKMFAFYLLQSITQKIKQASHGASMLHMTKAGMEAWAVNLPSMRDQIIFANFVDKIEKIKSNFKNSLKVANDCMRSLQYQAFTTGFNA